MPISSKVAYPKPETKTAVGAFLDLAGITDDSFQISTKKSVSNSRCQRAFETLKKALISEPVLSSPDVSKTFIVQIDASDRGVGAVLSQVQVTIAR